VWCIIQLDLITLSFVLSVPNLLRNISPWFFEVESWNRRVEFEDVLIWCELISEAKVTFERSGRVVFLRPRMLLRSFFLVRKRSFPGVNFGTERACTTL
jgi:hypothetical protein